MSHRIHETFYLHNIHLPIHHMSLSMHACISECISACTHVTMYLHASHYTILYISMCHYIALQIILHHHIWLYNAIYIYNHIYIYTGILYITVSIIRCLLLSEPGPRTQLLSCVQTGLTQLVPRHLESHRHQS